MFIESVQELVAKKGITVAKMLKDLGLGQGTFSTWKQRGTVPGGETLRKIADYFDVSVDYLLNGETQPGQSAGEDEMQDVIIYHLDGKTVRRKYPKAKYDAILKMLEAMDDSDADL